MLLVRAAIGSLSSDLAARKISVRLTRVGPRRLDSDNLAAALKHVRDGVADALGVDDGDPRLEWIYDQQRCRPGEYAVLVDIRPEDRSHDDHHHCRHPVDGSGTGRRNACRQNHEKLP